MFVRCSAVHQFFPLHDAQISVPKEQEETGAQSKLDYWKEADWRVVEVRQRWSRLVNDLLNSSVCILLCEIYRDGGRQREKRNSPPARMCVCQKAKAFGIVRWCDRGMKADRRNKCNSWSFVLRSLFVSETETQEKKRGEKTQSSNCRDEGVCFVCLSQCICVCVRERKVAKLSGSLAVQPCSLCLAYRRRNLK